MGFWPRLGLYAAGLSTLTLWILICAAGFWYLLGSTPQGISDDYVSSLAWPFVAVLVAVPTIAVMLVGGLQMLGQVLSLKGFLQELPSQVSSLEKLNSQMEKQREKFELMKEDIEEAAGTIDLTSSQIADLQATLDRIRRFDATEPQPVAAGDNLVERLTEHLNRSKEIFDSGARHYSAEFGEEIERVRGWILETSVRELKDQGALSAEDATYVTATLDIDRKTRRAGRRNLERADIERLDHLMPRAE